MPEYEVRPKMRRKKRKAEGEDIFAALTKDRAILDLGHDKGLKCRSCGRWRPWRDLHTKYEVRGSDVLRLWFCHDCGDMLKEDNATDHSIRLKTDDDPRQVLVFSGDRRWTDVKSVSKVLDRYDPHSTIVRHGKCRGLDEIADRLARAKGFEVDPMPADWGTYHRAAGPIRNQAMLDKEPRPARVHAFHDDLASSKGTANMLMLAKRAKVPATLHRHRSLPEA